MKYKVLVVEDNELMRETLREMLSSLGFEVHLAASGKEAIRFIGGCLTPDIALVDIMMPDIDGMQTMAEINRRLPNTKLIATSGDEASEMLFRGLRLRGLKNILPKPFSMEELGVMVSNVLGIQAGDLGEELIG